MKIKLGCRGCKNLNANRKAEEEHPPLRQPPTDRPTDRQTDSGNNNTNCAPPTALSLCTSSSSSSSSSPHTTRERTNNQNQLFPHSLQENLEFSLTPNSPPLPPCSFFDLRSSILLPCSILVSWCRHSRAERTQRVQTQREGKKKNTCSGLPAGHCYCICLVCLLINTVVHQKVGEKLHKAGERERERNSRRFFRAKLGSAKSWADRAPRGAFKVAA